VLREQLKRKILNSRTAGNVLSAQLLDKLLRKNFKG